MRSAQLSAVAYNDFSNMNAGHFPDHTSHNTGEDVDGAWMINGQARFSVNKDTAERLIALFQSEGGSSVDFVYVTFQATPGNEFWDTIRNASVGGERLIPNAVASDAETVGASSGQARIRNEGRVRYRPEHSTHFHIRWKD